MEANLIIASNKMVNNALESGETEKLEKRGYVSKRNTKGFGGFFQTRYFATQGRKLAYWQDEAAYLTEQAILRDIDKDNSKYVSTGTEYDIVAIRTMEIAPDRVLLCRFSNDKFKLDLQFRSETERSEWMTILQAKKNLHSVHELRRAIGT